MPQSENAVNACDVSLWIDDQATPGVLTDVSGSSNIIAMNFDLETGEWRSFQSRWNKRLQCGKDAQYTITVVYSNLMADAFQILKDWFFADKPGSKQISVYIPDKNVGADYYDGQFVLTNLTWTGDPSEPGPILVQATVAPDGPVTVDTTTT